MDVQIAIVMPEKHILDYETFPTDEEIGAFVERNRAYDWTAKAIAKAIIREAIENTAFAESAYPELKEKLIKAVEDMDIEPESTAKQKEYAIEADCMYDRERFEWVPTRWQCGCCHAEVKRTDTECWHCRSKLRRKDENY